MNDNSSKRGVSGHVIGLAITVGVLLFSAAEWFLFVKTADSAGIAQVSQAPLRPDDITDIKARAAAVADASPFPESTF